MEVWAQIDSSLLLNFGPPPETGIRDTHKTLAFSRLTKLYGHPLQGSKAKSHNAAGGCSRNSWPGARHRGIRPVSGCRACVLTTFPMRLEQEMIAACRWPAAASPSCSEKAAGNLPVLTYQCQCRRLTETGGVRGRNSCVVVCLPSHPSCHEIPGSNAVIGFHTQSRMAGLVQETQVEDRMWQSSEGLQQSQAFGRPTLSTGFCHAWRRGGPRSRHTLFTELP